ncbi:MAG: hypothetical protein WBP54_06495, partial [Pelodictyon phaeoclathratiforme]
RMGGLYQQNVNEKAGGSGIQKVRQFLASADIETWNQARPTSAPLSGREYKQVWKVISGGER